MAVIAVRISPKYMSGLFMIKAVVQNKKQFNPLTLNAIVFENLEPPLSMAIRFNSPENSNSTPARI
jgi:hypothetical protein